LALLPTRNDQLLTVSQVAEQLQVTAQTIRNWIDGGVLPAARIGRGFRIRREDVDELLARASAQSGSLATRRDVWAPTTRSLPRAAQPTGLPSLWGGTGLASLPKEPEN
jgi:excisionase family DNA binding protein